LAHCYPVAVAVVVQKMIQSEISGICFTVHPVIQDRNQMVVEAGYGLGEAIVGGKITPDTYIISKKDWVIIDTNISEQEMMIIRQGNGIKETRVPKFKQSKQKLSDKKIIELAKLCQKIEEHYKKPQDIEFAIERNKLYITQSRPITTLIESEKKIAKLDIGEYGDYQRLFQGSGMPFLVSHIFMDYYKNLNGLSIFIDNMWTTFLPKKIVEKTLKEGLKLYSNKKLFVKYRDEFEDNKKECIKFFKKILSNKRFSKQNVKKILELTSKNFFYYSKTEFFYLDKAYEYSKKDKTTKENLKQFDKIKNSGREHLNKIFFGETALLFRFLSKLAKQFLISVKDLEIYGKNEILTLFEGKRVNSKTLDKRRKSFVMQTDGKELIIIYGDESRDIAKNFIGFGEKDKEIIKGITASKGKVKGKVKIIDFGYDKFHLFKKMIKEMNKGDILVAETTAPELMAACKKAGAILTNQGGQMSHAAIVSRELKIPCLVGMGNITDILKDGDLVEVDANKGIVKILKRR